METRLVIFDCDGVLIDSELIACSVHASTLSSLGFPMSTKNVIARFTGISSAEMRAAIEFENAQRLPKEFESLCAAAVEAEFRRKLKVTNGIHKQLDNLISAKMASCVASSSPQERLESVLKQVDLWDYFAPNVFSASQVKAGKPAPHLFLYAAGQMNIDPSRCLVVEDSVPGVCAARAAGMKVVGFVGGAHCDAEHATLLLDAGAFATFSNIEVLSHFID